MLCDMSGIGKSIETESRMMIDKGWKSSGGEMESDS